MTFFSGETLSAADLNAILLSITGNASAITALQAADVALNAAVSALQTATADTGWQAASLQNSWTYYGAPFSPPAYRRVGGIVYLRGLVRNGTPGTTIFTLPAGYQPTTQLLVSGIDSVNFGSSSGFVDGANIPNTSNPVAGSGVVNHVHPHAHQHNTSVVQPLIPNTGIRVDISSAGAVQHSASGSNGYCSLDGITFLNS